MKNHLLPLFAIALIALLALSAFPGPPRAGGHPESLAAFIPELDWLEPKGPIQKAEGLESLFALINGGAEAYISQGFVRAVFQSLAAKDGRVFHLEIYELEQPAGAKALFRKKTSGLKKLGLGDGAARGDYYLICLKDRYYISITGPDSKPTTLDRLQELARAVLARMED